MKKNLLKSCLSAGMAVMLLIGTGSSFSYDKVSATETEAEKEYTLSFDLQGYESEEPFESVKLKANKKYTLSSAEPDTGKDRFSGWTYDDFYIYEPGDVFTMPAQDVTLKPVVVNADQEGIYSIIYDCGEYELNGVISGNKFVPYSAATITTNYCSREGYNQFGWTDGTNVYTSTQKIIMPEHDIVLTPNWLKIYNVYYQTGDVDNVNGKNEVILEKREGISFELADSARLSRLGYNLTGWLSDYDGKVYQTEETVIMPSSDVHYTAVWTPALFSVSLYSNNSMKQKIVSKEEYNSKMVLPECSYRYYGYKFTGWKYKTEIYQPGDEFTIPALFPGQSVTLSAQWEADADFDTTAEIDVFSMVETRKKFNEEKTDVNDLNLVSSYVKGNY